MSGLPRVQIEVGHRNKLEMSPHVSLTLYPCVSYVWLPLLSAEVRVQWMCYIHGRQKLMMVTGAVNQLCAKYNIMRLVSNNKIKMAAHRRNSAYYVFVLYDHFLRTNDEDVECSL